MSSVQPVLPENVAVNIQESSGQIAVGNYVVQIGSVHGGVVNIAMPEQQPRLRPRPTPVLLRPRRFPGLLDRKAEAETATVALQSAQLVDFYGQAGLGKTSLFRHLAYHLPSPDGVVYLSARHQSAADLLQFLFDAFYESDIPFKPAEAQVRHALQNTQALVLLDDVELAQAEVEVLLNTVPNSAFLLASSERCLWGEGRAVALRGLPPADALILVERELGRSLTPEDRPLAQALCAVLDGHPLYLLQVAAVVREEGRSLVEVVRQAQQGTPDETLAAQVLASLSEPEQRVIGVLAALGGAPVSFNHLAALTGLPNPAPVLEPLLRRHLVQAHSPRYSLTGNLGQAWFQAWDITPVAGRALTYFTGWAEQQQHIPDRLLAEADTMLQLLAWATEAGRWQEALRLARVMEGVLSLRGRWDAWAQVLQGGQQAAEALGDRAAKAWALHQLGTRALCLEDMALARTYLGRALRLRETLGDQVGAAITRHNLNILLPAPPSTNGHEPPDSPSSSSPSPSPSVSSPPLLGLGSSTLLKGIILALSILLVAIGGLWGLSRVWPSTVVPTATLSVIFVMSTPTPVVVPPTDTSTPTSIPPSPTATATLTRIPPAPTSTATLMPTPVPPTDIPTPTPPPPPTSTPTVAPSGSPVVCQPPPNWVAYVTQIGDTLNSLAIRTNTSVYELQLVNCLDSYTLQVGQTIYLPFTPPTPTVTNTPTATQTPSPTFTPTLTPTPTGRPLLDCVDFEDLPSGAIYRVKDRFVDSDTTITVRPFFWAKGTPPADSGFTQVDNARAAGGSGKEMAINNVNLDFNFHAPLTGLSLLFGEYGGNLNLEINGDFQNFANFTDIDRLTVGGANVSVIKGHGANIGGLNLTGRIDSFAIGGQELWIDDVCPQSGR